MFLFHLTCKNLTIGSTNQKSIYLLRSIVIKNSRIYDGVYLSSIYHHEKHAKLSNFYSVESTLYCMQWLCRKACLTCPVLLYEGVSHVSRFTFLTNKFEGTVNIKINIFTSFHCWKTSIAGICEMGSLRDTNPSSKWYVSPSENHYRRYHGICHGIGNITSIHTLHNILKVYVNIPYIYLEDVYIGFCAKRLGYKLVNLGGFFREEDI
jgi:hypothetical protein